LALPASICGSIEMPFRSADRSTTFVFVAILASVLAMTFVPAYAQEHGGGSHGGGASSGSHGGGGSSGGCGDEHGDESGGCSGGGGAGSVHKGPHGGPGGIAGPGGRGQSLRGIFHNMEPGTKPEPHSEPGH
jgi:hypothetical protein